MKFGDSTLTDISNVSVLGSVISDVSIGPVTALYGNSPESPPSAQVSSVPSAPISPEDVALATPLLGSDRAGGIRFSISIPQSAVGKFYQAVTSRTLADSAWPRARAAFQGNGGLLRTQILVVAGERRRFYKVKVWRE